MHRNRIQLSLWRRGVFCRERSERYRNTEGGDAERVAMAGEFVEVR